MGKLKLATKSVGKFISKNSTTILTSVGIAGMGADIVMAVKATPKALEMIDEVKGANGGEITGKQLAKVGLKAYWPTATVFVGSATCLIFANNIGIRRNVALAAAYRISEGALRDYQEAIIEEVGEKKATLIKDRVAKKHVERAVESGKDSEGCVVLTGDGDYWCLDSISGRFFKSNIEKIRQAVNSFNKKMITDNVVCLNDWYDEINLPHIDIGYGLGWVMERTSDMLDISYTTAMKDEQVPCLVLQYMVEPTYDFRDY